MWSNDFLMQQLAQSLVNTALARKAVIGLAESCTGGRVAAAITSVSGASSVFAGGVVAYSNEIKESLLGVRRGTLDEFGAVSAETALEMAEGVRRVTGASHCVSITGIAGPTGATLSKPVGRVYIGLATPHETRVERFQFTGTRQNIQTLATESAMRILMSVLSK